MKKVLYFGIFATGLLATGCSSTKYGKANIEYDKMAYYKAAENNAAYLEKHNKPQAMLRLADSYRQMHDYARAEYWYEKSIHTEYATANDKLAYATVLKANGKYADAATWFQQYLTTVPGDAGARAQMISCHKPPQNEASVYVVKPLNINTTTGNFALTPFENGYVFCSERGGLNKNINPWNGRPYTGLLYTQKNDNGLMSNPTPFGTLNCPYHNGPVAFSPSYDRAYITRSNYSNGKLVKDKNDVNNMQLYTARRGSVDWMDITPMPFNDKGYSCGQPAVSADGNTLFFVSDMPGGTGKTDLYMCVNENGNWSAPRNMGKNFNTDGYEMFPTYYKGKNGTVRLYFSTDGMEGLGGMDLYYSEQQADGSWGAAVHMPAPFNSTKDDFGMLMAADGKSGYFSSSRNGNGNVDELFSFDAKPQFFVDGSVFNKKTMRRIKQAMVQVHNASTGQRDLVMTDDQGKFFMPLAENTRYAFDASHEKYLPGSEHISTEGKTTSETLEVRIFLDSIGYVLSLANIYYDFDKWHIRKDAARQLDTLAEIMKEHADMYLELDAHADSRGSQRYNLKLTERRARAVVKYLASRGIDPRRLDPKWFGKAKPAVVCGTCTTAKHQQNRRTEFKILAETNKVTYSGSR
jgi:peptidoglycan-associated lipoprotein